MTLDLDAIAREAGFQVMTMELNGCEPIKLVQAVSSTTFRPELQRFAALLLEKVAQNHDEAAKAWGDMASGCSSGMYDNMRWAAQQLAEEVRSMAAEMGE